MCNVEVTKQTNVMAGVGFENINAADYNVTIVASGVLDIKCEEGNE